MSLELKCSVVTLCLLLGACGEAKNDFFDDTAGTNGTAIPSNQSSTPGAGGSETSITASTSDSTGTGGSGTGGSGTGGSDTGGSDTGGSDAEGSDAGGSDAEGSDAEGSDGGGSTSQSTAMTTGAEAATAETTSSGGTATSTTGASNDPECPESAPEGTTFCTGMVGLSCSYDDVTCVCSGLSWNCTGGETTSGGTGSGMGPGFGSNGNDANSFGTGGTFND